MDTQADIHTRTQRLAKWIHKLYEEVHHCYGTVFNAHTHTHAHTLTLRSPPLPSSLLHTQTPSTHTTLLLWYHLLTKRAYNTHMHTVDKWAKREAGGGPLPSDRDRKDLSDHIYEFYMLRQVRICVFVCV